MRFVVACLLALTLAAPAHAELPCGPVQSVQHQFRFHGVESTNAAPVSGYRMYVRELPAGSPTLVNLGLPAADANGDVTVTPSLGFDTSKRWGVSFTANGPGGESAHSDEVTVEATSAGVCPPPQAPAAPTNPQLLQ